MKAFALFVAFALVAVYAAHIEPCSSPSDCDYHNAECVGVPIAEGATEYCQYAYRGDRYNCQGFPQNICCTDSDCQQELNRNDARCLAWPGATYCGGAAPIPQNECYLNKCETSEDCPAGESCIPRGTFGKQVNDCVPTQCQTDADCNKASGGQCTPMLDPIVACRQLEIFVCTYDSSACRTDLDCPISGHVCNYSFTSGRNVCIQPFPPPP